MYGRKLLLPRLTLWVGDPGTRYTYSGIVNEPAPFDFALARLRDILHKTFGRDFNSCLVNVYRDGNDSVGYHADNEHELGPNPFIVSISIGETRRFLVKENCRQFDEKPQTETVLLESGDLCIMKGDFQSKYLHSVPKTKQSCGLRFNLTFRYVADAEYWRRWKIFERNKARNFAASSLLD
jgi:alkylated DNA repair dioxygenase AlkB